jgi:thioredoxin 1
MSVNWVLLQLNECPCSGGKSRPLLLLGAFAVAVVLAGWIRRRSEKKGGASMNAAWKAIVAVALIASVVAILALKQGGKNDGGHAAADAPALPATAAAMDGVKADSATEPKKALPRLVDLGSVTCIPCKMMMPVLEELKKEYAGRLSVEFYDVRENPDAATKYGVKLIPTQIFYDAAGKELFRHEGFFAKEDILAKWKEFGVDLSGATD